MLVAILAILTYLISLLLIVPILMKNQINIKTIKTNKTLFFCTALSALILHGFSLFSLFFEMINHHSFTLINIASLVSLIMVILLTPSALKINTIWFLLPIVFSFAIINLILTVFLPNHLLMLLSEDIGLFIHIILALLAYAICFIATLYAIQLRWIDHNLKQKKLNFPMIMPPLMTVERHFFRILLAGEIFLTLALISGSIYLPDFFATQNIQKAIFSFISWILFAVLLIGHQKCHLSGKRVIIGTISGMILLTIAYFGSRAMLNI